ncbi:hypothetical protein HKCCE2091_01150 [Rhodobacterales bacterium HKCCE2091]|nr:hypothetical protein [Rhodobacterales bacterium HKCCE2091]
MTRSIASRVAVAALVAISAASVAQAQAVRVNPGANLQVQQVNPRPGGAVNLSAIGVGDAGDVHSCTWGNDNLAHCMETLCAAPVRDGDDFLCDDVPVCYNHYGQVVPCS